MSEKKFVHDPRAMEIFSRLQEEHMEEYANELDSSFGVALTSCESPIEQQMFAALMFMATGWHPITRIPVEVNGWAQSDQVIIIPQHQIGRYRVDFAIHAEFHKCPEMPLVRIAVECDGHDFHEKTKEQAARDKLRDRVLAGNGYTVLRFTGSEIYADAEACVQQVANVIAAEIDAAIQAHLGNKE